MDDISEPSILYPRVGDAFDGKSVILTGATGYLGTVILEILLRCCPGIHKIYVLLRTKKGKLPDERLNEVLNKDIFTKIKEEMPQVLQKIYLVPGDIAETNLGMNEHDAKLVAEEATVFFHVASNITFFKPISYMLKNNLIGADNVIEFCKKCKRIDVLVYTSTAYSNSYILDDYVKEIIYPIPETAESIVEDLRNGKSDEYFMEKFSKWDKKFHNFYIISKNLSENLLIEKASDLPVAIVRPSIISLCWKEPLPGYVERGNAIIDFAEAYARGFIRVVLCDSNKIINSVPADVVGNTHIVAAWSIISKRFPSPFVVNCTNVHTLNFWKDYFNAFKNSKEFHLVPKGFLRPSIIITTNKTFYKIMVIFEHYIHGYAFDFFLKLMNKQPRLIRMYRFLDKLSEKSDFFLLNEWKFSGENFKELSLILSPYDEKMFYLNFEEFTPEKLIEAAAIAGPIGNWKSDKLTPEQRKRVVFYQTLFAYFLKYTVIILILSFLSFAAYKFGAYFKAKL